MTAADLTPEEEEKLFQSQSFFGPSIWKTIHSLAAAAATGDPAQETDRETAFLSFLTALDLLLPCLKCRNEYIAYKSSTPPAKPYFQWTVAFHNSVNARLGKSQFPLLQAEIDYGLSVAPPLPDPPAQQQQQEEVRLASVQPTTDSRVFMGFQPTKRQNAQTFNGAPIQLTVSAPPTFVSQLAANNRARFGLTPDTASPPPAAIFTRPPGASVPRRKCGCGGGRR